MGFLWSVIISITWVWRQNAQICWLACSAAYVCMCLCYLCLCMLWLVSDRTSCSEVSASWEPKRLTSLGFLAGKETEKKKISLTNKEKQENDCSACMNMCWRRWSKKVPKKSGWIRTLGGSWENNLDFLKHYRIIGTICKMQENVPLFF